MVRAVIGLLQLCCLAGFAFGVYWLSSKAPRRIAPRVFKLQWMAAAVGCGLLFFLIMAKVINVPARITTTPTALVDAHNAIRATCHGHLQAGQFEHAYASINKRTKTAELVGAHAEKLKAVASGKTGLAKMMQPFLNTVLFHTGVTITFVPALVRLLLLLWEMRRQQQAGVRDPRKEEKVRREWGVLLPIMHAVTLLSLCVSPTFYFFIEPGRATRCVYSSGHWYTFTCTCLTFAIVISHLYRNREYSKSCMQLLVWYFAWCVTYLAMALTVLATTQQFYHDDFEAVDGIMQALPAFAVFMVILVAYQFLTASSRDIGDGPEKQVLEEGEEEVDAVLPAALSSKAQNVLGVESQAASSKAKKVLGLKEDAPAAKKSSSTKKGSSKKKKTFTKKPAPPVAADDEDDAVLVEAETESPVAAASSSAAAPSAPPMAPSPPTAAAPKSAIKITKKAPSQRAAPLAEDPASALLSGIKAGVKLRKTTAGSSRGGSTGAAPDGLMAMLAKVRLAVDGEKEEENDDTDWNN